MRVFFSSKAFLVKQCRFFGDSMRKSVLGEIETRFKEESR
jgi:hypothetical protein